MSLIVLLSPTTQPDKLGLTALCGLGLAAVLFGRSIWRRPGWGFLFLALAAATTLPFAVIYRAFGQVDMVSVLFHADAGVAGTNPLMFRSEVIASLLALLFLGLATYFIAMRFRMRWLPVLVAAALVVTNPYVVFKAKYLLSPLPDVDLLAMMVQPEAVPRADLPDIVYIYLEGTDRRFLDATHAPKSSEIYREFEAEGASFTGIDQIAGTGWSMAGIVASQCGVPLLPRGALRNSMEGEIHQSFMPGSLCLGDMLQQLGYDTSVVFGTFPHFAGGYAFFATHGYGRIFSKVEMPAYFAQDEVAAASIDWLVDDQMLYDRALQDFSASLTGAAPIALNIRTSGPHGSTSYLSRRCTVDGRMVETKSPSDASECLAELTKNFVAAVRVAHKDAARGRELRIILQSDHFNHGKVPSSGAPDQRRNLLILLGGAERGRVIARQGSALDIYPTLLDWLALSNPSDRAGLGVSLLHESGETLLERYPRVTLDGIVTASISMFSVLWEGSH